MKKKVEASLFIILAVVCVYLVIFIFPNQIPKSLMHDSNISSWIAPMIGITVIFVTSIFEIYFTLKSKGSPQIKKTKDKGSVLLLIAIVTIFLYVFVGIKFLGFHVSTVLFLVFLMLFLGEKRLTLVFGVSLGVTIFIHLLFTSYLGIHFPKGILL